jgi:hypothetical protein
MMPAQSFMHTLKTMHRFFMNRRRFLGTALAMGALTACTSKSETGSTSAQAPNTGFELHLLNGTFSSLELGYEPEPAIAKLTASIADAAIVLREDDVDYYDWTTQRLRLNQPATVRALKSMKSGQRSTPESILSMRGFVVTVDGAPQFAGIALERISAMAIQFPVFYVDVTNAAKLELSFRPHHALGEFDPNDGAWSAVRHKAIKERFGTIGKLTGDNE